MIGALRPCAAEPGTTAASVHNMATVRQNRYTHVLTAPLGSRRAITGDAGAGAGAGTGGAGGGGGGAGMACLRLIRGEGISLEQQRTGVSQVWNYHTNRS